MSETDATQQFRIDAESESSTRTAVETRGFEFVVDEPEAAGGTDEGPTPVEYLLGSWAGCLNVVAHLVADERDIEIESLDLSIEGDLDPRAFQGISEDERAGYQEIRVRIDAETDADEETLQEWLAAVERRCPVGDNIQNATPTAIELVDESAAESASVSVASE
ncbi:OsmC family protein [Halopenitus persicus]|uniref:OsmC family protein n=1 Tax=Halopenitus persicus TaxID=1048396 RepID=UPI000BBB22C8|nr:OsmC family protein [Halopenitus persicus]